MVSRSVQIAENGAFIGKVDLAAIDPVQLLK